ncbi:hypothetical protein AB1Y20_002161 [Prymnesium parvum]|uniref:Serine racemase n=1 Tax=Prymnesium parvum TaxID=97485 RepID=A0AB34J9U8_PRYPA
MRPSQLARVAASRHAPPRAAWLPRRLSSSAAPPHALPASDCVKFEDCVRASHRIRSGIIHTECSRSHWLSETTACHIYLKKEQMQFTGSFKERGARNAIMSLSPQQREKGVIAASAGNHALALAWHGRQLNVPVTVVMPTVAPMTKVQNCKSFGANVIIHGAHIGEAKEWALTGDPANFEKTYINGYDDVEIIAGTGTLGIEMLQDVPNADVIVVPVGGAGLIAGIALAAKTLNPTIKIIGVEPRRCASYTAALEAGYPVKAHVLPTLADGLAVPQVGPHAFVVARRWVDEVVCVDEKDVALAVLRLVEQQKMVVEGGGATGLAALLPGGPLDRPDMKGKHVLVPLCGGNIDVNVLGRVIERGLAADGRLVRLTIAVSDRPGGIADLASVLAKNGASVKDIFHERAWLHTSVDQVTIKAVLETLGPEHNNLLMKSLTTAYPGVDIKLEGTWCKDSID